MLTRRGEAFAFGAIIATLAAAFTLNLIPTIIAVFLVAFLGVELALFGAAVRTVGPDWFAVERIDASTRVPTGGFGITRLRITHPTPVPFCAEVADSIPDVFEVVRGTPHLTTWWPTSGALTLSYVYRPKARGVYTIGPTEVVVHDALGLAFRRIRLDTRLEVRVSPAAPQVALRRSALRLLTRPIGVVTVARRGYGTEFRALRPYTPEDDYRAIAWRRSQAGRLYVREFEQESRQDFLVVISLAPEMAAGTVGDTALDRACEAGMLLAQYIPRGGDQIGLMLLDPAAPTFYPPGRGKLQMLRISEALTAAVPCRGRTDLGALLRSLPLRLKQPTHVFAFAPLPESLDPVLATFPLFRSAGHRLYLFPPDFCAMYPAFPDQMRRVLYEFTASNERYQGFRRRSTLQRVGIPVYEFDRQGTGHRLLSLYQQIHNWGVGH